MFLDAFRSDIGWFELGGWGNDVMPACTAISYSLELRSHGEDACTIWGAYAQRETVQSHVGVRDPDEVD
jgi:hypothetical protein